MFSMAQLAMGTSRATPLDVAESAFAALEASGTVCLTENVARTLKRVRQAGGHDNSPISRALACSLCCACAANGVHHNLSPVDAGTQWKATEVCLVFYQRKTF